LLSINAFQRGLADAEPLIRALALRVLTSIRLPDILQIQILGVQKCARDKSAKNCEGPS
jgi:AP-3 complex subunit beta